MLEQRLADMRAELGTFDDEFTRYAFLVELSAYVSPDQPDLMRDEYLQRGCQSRVWLCCEQRDGCLWLRATSDTLIIRGILYILGELYNGVPLSEVASSQLDVLRELGIAEHFNDARQSGIASISAAVVSYCRQAVAGQAAG
jgi:cysteine desulfuration protein SufE